MHEQCIEINTSQTNQCKSSLSPSMVRAKTASGCELANNELNQSWIGHESPGYTLCVICARFVHSVL